MKHTVIFIVGPTSSGKSRVAARLAERITGEIISCDSMQVYREMDVITQSPDSDLLSRVAHHLIREINPEEEFNAAEFTGKAEALIGSITSRGKVPIICGGTGLYVKALVDGLFSSPSKDEDLRKKFNEIAEKKGTVYLHQMLEERDPETASKLHPNDTRRIIRALEVYKLTGKTINDKKTTSAGIAEKYACKRIGLKVPRKVLYDRINANVDKMFSEGLVDEVRRLKERELSLTAEKALGIKEVLSFLDGKTTLGGAREELKKNTRRYAKRQMTWFRADKRIVWIDADRPVEEIVEETIDKISGAGKDL
ncbi:MAG: tRNA (adenosine(37)-N6)-dimethylallyltransferase MiaA [Candidatus Omnitrophica bacterium]|nr:tRNA (adenosine(37)-N6)-dimethylallyltransferase MiaA [Candidatus Omnitrophota bacterium]